MTYDFALVPVLGAGILETGAEAALERVRRVLGTIVLAIED